MQTFNYHLYYYKMIIIHNDTDNDDMVFQCDSKTWLLCNNMDNIDMENCKWLWNDWNMNNKLEINYKIINVQCHG
jgi:hypothetical protein